MNEKFCFVVCANFSDWVSGHSSSYPVRVFLSEEEARSFMKEDKTNPSCVFSLYKVIFNETFTNQI